MLLGSHNKLFGQAQLRRTECLPSIKSPIQLHCGLIVQLKCKIVHFHFRPFHYLSAEQLNNNIAQVFLRLFDKPILLEPYKCCCFACKNFLLNDPFVALRSVNCALCDRNDVNVWIPFWVRHPNPHPEFYNRA